MSALNRPRVFVGSSSEGLPIAANLRVLLDRDCEVEVWSEGVFEPGGVTLLSLMSAAGRFDFAVLVTSADDTTISRGTTANVARDNVIFELGLFMGALGSDRTFMLFDRTNRPTLPTDLSGVTPIDFQPHSTGHLEAALGAPATKLKNHMARLGLLPRGSGAELIADPPMPANEPPAAPKDPHAYEHGVLDQLRKLIAFSEGLTLVQSVSDHPFDAEIHDSQTGKMIFLEVRGLTVPGVRRKMTHLAETVVGSFNFKKLTLDDPRLAGMIVVADFVPDSANAKAAQILQSSSRSLRVELVRYLEPQDGMVVIRAIEGVLGHPTVRR